MNKPQFPGGKPFMPVCGNQAQAKALAMNLATDLGLDAVDIGDISKAALVENMGLLWGALRDVEGSRDFAFSLLRS